MPQPDRILKVDAAGRVWTPREQREAVLDEFERSGVPAAKFAQCNVSVTPGTVESARDWHTSEPAKV